MQKLSIIVILLVILPLNYAGYCYFTKPVSPFEEYATSIPGTYRIGYTNLEQESTAVSLLTKGNIPSWLKGILFRNGPALFAKNNSWVVNAFDGLAMIHAFSINDGAVTYTNQFLKTSAYKSVQKTGKMSYAGFAQDPCASHFKWFLSLFVQPGHEEEKKQSSIPNANVNIAQYTDRFVALTEVPLPVEFNPHTLETIGVFDYQDSLPRESIHDTAHPHYDPLRKEHLGYYTEFDRMSKVHVYSIKDGSTTRSILASYEVEEPSYMHSFAITPQYAILTMLPFVVNPMDLLSGKPFITNFKWKPERGTKIVVIDRINNTIIGQYTTEPFFAFHTINAFEKNNDEIVLDIASYSQPASDINDTLASLLAPQPIKHSPGHPLAEPESHEGETGTLTRYIINLKQSTISSKLLSQERIELPRINYDYNGHEYTYVYAYAQSKGSTLSDKLIKINVQTGDVLEWKEAHCFPGEPVFIAKPEAAAEDDGVVLTVVLDAAKNSSFLLVLDATTFSEIARAQTPHHIPFGFHGLFASIV